MESQSLSCYQSRNNATQGHLGNTKLYSATDRKVSITEQIKVKRIKLHFYRTITLSYCPGTHYPLYSTFTIKVGFCGFFVLSSEGPFGLYKLTPPMHNPTLVVQKHHLH